MKTDFNLLPWRLNLHQQRSKKMCSVLMRFFFTVGIIGMLALFLNNELSQQKMQLEQQLATLQQQAERLKPRIQQLSAKMVENAQEEALDPLPNEQILQLLALLQAAPLQSGELNELDWTENIVQLRGTINQHTEFEQFNQFLKQAKCFSQVNLKQFLPLNNGALQFEFELIFKSLDKNNQEIYE
ncbi:MAG: hypothetical protein Q4A81_03315 [Pasteurellaceae bacterium]|nr:hypothetical protein [Pasteurellaceae bacterium]